MTAAIASLALAVSLLLAVSPQVPLRAETPVGVSVVKASWQKLSFRPGWDAQQDPASSNDLQDTRNDTSRDANGNPTGTSTPLPSTGVPATRSSERIDQRKNPRTTRENDTFSAPSAPGQRVDQYVYQVKILNVGNKTIEAIDWEYLFSGSDAASRHRFQTFRRVKPGNLSNLAETSLAPPKRILNAAGSADPREVSEARILIHCVLYSDGTLNWRSNGSESECDALKNQGKTR